MPAGVVLFGILRDQSKGDSQGMYQIGSNYVPDNGRVWAGLPTGDEI